MSSQANEPVEPLERRRLFTAIALSNGVLNVTGNVNLANTITVGLSADAASVVASVTYETGRGAHAKSHTVSKSFLLNGTVTMLRIVGGNKADTITVDQTHGSFGMPTTIYGGNGNDTITCGDEPDLVYGGNGNDSINGGAGNDSLYGQGGNDVLIGGAGDDFLSGRRGRDCLEGDAGNDTLLDPFGPDIVLGGAGNNLFQVHSIKLDVDNDYDVAKDTLQIVALPDRTPATSTGGLSGLLGSAFPILSLL